MSDYVQIFQVSILRPAAGDQLIDLQDCQAANVSGTKTKNRVNAMRRERRSAGFRSGVYEPSGSFEYQLAKNPEVPWEAMCRDDEVIQIRFKEDQGGRRFMAVDAEIESFEKGSNAEGEPTMTVNWVATDYYQL